MTKNLEAADRITKLSLSGMTVILYFLDLIKGPFATGLLVLSLLVIVFFLLKLLLAKKT